MAKAIQGRIVIDLAANRPPAVPRNKDITFIAKDAGTIETCDGTTWSSTGGGTSIPGMTGDGNDPAGLQVSGTVYAAAFEARQDANGKADLHSYGLHFDRYTDISTVFTARLSVGSSGEELSLYNSDLVAMWQIDAEGVEHLAGGLGLFGHTPMAAPRTLAQSVITAITDANAKTAVQAVADALADMGALTLT